MRKRKQRVAAPKKKGTLDRLSGDEAATVLRLLLKRHPELAKEISALAGSVIGEVSIEEIADTVEDEVRSLDLEDLNSRAGRHAYGYVEPTQAAWDLVEETVMPFLEDIKRRAMAGQQAAALNTCVGVVLGLYRLRNNDNDPFLGWAVDSPDEMAGEAVVTLRKALRKAKTARGAHSQMPSSTPFSARLRLSGPRCWSAAGAAQLEYTLGQG